MRKLFFLTCALFLFVGAQAQLTGLTNVFNPDKLVGLWEFKTEATATTATLGNNLAVVNEELTFWQEVDGIGTMRLNGGSSRSSGLELVHGLAATDGATYVQKYALMFDIKIDENKGGGNNLSALYYTGQKTDGCVFLGFSDNSNAARVNGIGCGNYKKDALLPGEWNRILVNVDLADKKKIEISVVHPDGTIVFHDGITDLKANIVTSNLLYLLGEGNNDTEYGRLNVSKIALFDDYLTEEEVKGLTTCVLPKLSVDGSGPWHLIQVMGAAGDSRAGLYFTAYTDTEANGSIRRVSGTSLNFDDLDNQLWAVEGKAKNYRLINKKTGESVVLGVPTGKTQDFLLLSSETAATWDLFNVGAKTTGAIVTAPEGYLFLQCTSDITTTNFRMVHQSNEFGTASTNYALKLEGDSWGWGANSQFRFIEMEDFFVSDTEMNFGDVAVGKNSVKSATIAIGGDLTGTLECVLNDETGAFSINTDALDASKGGSLGVMFTPTAAWKVCEATIEVKIGDESKVINLSGTGQPVPEYPTISNATNGNVWYYVTMPRYSGEGKSFTAGAIGSNITRSLINKENNKNQIWKLAATEVADKYKLMDVAGNSVKLNTKLVSAVAEEGMSLGLQSNTSFTGVTAVSLMTGATATQHLDQQSDEVGTWSDPAGQGAAVTFIVVPENIYTDITTAAFGEVAVGESADEAAVVTGVNLEATHAVTYTIEGEDATAFAVEKGTDWADLYGGSLKVTFTPTEAKAYAAKLVLTTGVGTTEIELTGTGLQDPTIIADPAAALAFGDVVLNKKAIKSINVKGKNLTDNVTYQLTGEDAAIFTIDATDWTGEAAGSDLKVTALPTEEKEYTATIVFSSTDAQDVTITLTAKGYTPVLPVTLSTDTEDNWYYIFAERGKAYIQGFGANTAIANRASQEGADGQLWKFVDTEISGQYKVINKAGGELAYTKDAIAETTVEKDRMYIAEASANTFDFVASGAKWQLKCNELRDGAGSFMNKTSNSWEFCQYYVNGDGGNLLSFIPQAEMTEFSFPTLSSDTEEFWYYIQFSRNNNAANGLVVQSNGANADMKAADRVENATNQYWKVTGTEGNYVLTNYDGLSVKLVGSAFQVVETDDATVADALEILPAFSGDYVGDLTIKRKATTYLNGFNPSGGSSVGNKIAEYGVNDGGSALKFVAAPAIPLSSDATLKSLSLSAGVLTPAFSPDVTGYTSLVTTGPEITITAEANHPKATIEGDGVITLQDGGHIYTVSVTAEDGTKKNYMVIITYVPSSIDGPDASSVEFSAINGVLTATFEGTKDVKVYTTTGILVDNAQANASYVKALSDGVYVLVIDGISYKVLVK